MNTYLIVKTLHIISATLMVGTGFGTAFYLFWANRSGSVAAQSVVSHWSSKQIGGLRLPPSFSNPCPAYGCCTNAAIPFPPC